MFLSDVHLGGEIKTPGSATENVTSRLADIPTPLLIGHHLSEVCRPFSVAISGSASDSRRRPHGSGLGGPSSAIGFTHRGRQRRCRMSQERRRSSDPTWQRWLGTISPTDDSPQDGLLPRLGVRKLEHKIPKRFVRTNGNH